MVGATPAAGSSWRRPESRCVGPTGSQREDGLGSGLAERSTLDVEGDVTTVQWVVVLAVATFVGVIATGVIAWWILAS
jgi:phage shock protein PspC (stress-responsive transcriptional regulator)